MIMRWVFLAFLIINGGYFFYLNQLDASSNEKPSIEVSPEKTPANSIVLLSEAIAAGSVKKIVTPSAQVEEAKEKQPQLCTVLGAFPVEDAALQVQQRLMAYGIGSEVKPEKVSAASNYWVYIKPLADRTLAQKKYKALKSEGIDSYLMTDGEMKNAVSLGLFSKKKLAVRLLEKHQSRGEDVVMKEVPRFKFEYWVNIKPSDRELFSRELWAGLKQSYSFAEKHDKLCDDGIATTH